MLLRLLFFILFAGLLISGCTQLKYETPSIYNPMSLSHQTGAAPSVKMDSVDAFDATIEYYYAITSSQYNTQVTEQYKNNAENMAAKACAADPLRAIVNLKIRTGVHYTNGIVYMEKQRIRSVGAILAQPRDKNNTPSKP